ncbi:unnamed protein product [Rhizoctonia solani]|uniref:RRM domain-containing protein n=1 Tax=Rhizoctonia solani TaxID=456999 RepID=A0A8H3ED54_9AGAM|nr:unnamed protein product [Rhizoctonia solani]
MSSVAIAPVSDAGTAPNGVTSDAAATTNNAGTATAADATTPAAAPAGENKPASPEETGHKVFAGNLAYATTDDGLKTFFNAFANDIVSSEVIQRGSRPAGYGFVTFKTLEAAQKAVAELNDKELDGRPIIVQLAKPASEKEKERNERRTKRRATGRRNARAPPGEVTEAEAEGQAEDSKPGLVEKAENAVEGAAAAVSDAVKPKKKKKWGRKGKGKKSAATTTGGATEDEAVQATETPAGEPSAAGAEAPNGTTDSAPKKTKKPRAPRAPRPPRPAGEQPEGQPSKNMLFVANLAFSVDDARLKQIFTDAGINVVSARVVTRRWGARRSKGFGFVDVGSEEEQKKALAHFAPVESTDGTTPAAGKEIEGRQIAVKVAVDAPKREDGETDAEAAANSAEQNEAIPDTTVVAH